MWAKPLFRLGLLLRSMQRSHHTGTLSAYPLCLYIEAQQITNSQMICQVGGLSSSCLWISPEPPAPLLNSPACYSRPTLNSKAWTNLPLAPQNISIKVGCYLPSFLAPLCGRHVCRGKRKLLQEESCRLSHSSHVCGKGEMHLPGIYGTVQDPVCKCKGTTVINLWFGRYLFPSFKDNSFPLNAALHTSKNETIHGMGKSKLKAEQGQALLNPSKKSDSTVRVMPSHVNSNLHILFWKLIAINLFVLHYDFTEWLFFNKLVWKIFLNMHMIQQKGGC